MLEFYFRFRLLRMRHHRHVILHLLAKFHPNQTINDTVMTSYPFLKTAATHRNSTSGFVFCDFAHLRRSKSTCGPNFGEISKSTAEILLFSVSENKTKKNKKQTSGFNFHVCVAINMSFFICQTSSKSDHLRQSYDATSIFQDANKASQFYFRFRFSWLRLFRKVEIYPQTNFGEISLSRSRYQYYYFRFLKINVCHVGVLLPVSILTFASRSACDSSSACQTSSKSDHPRQSFDVISIFTMADAASQLYFRFSFRDFAHLERSKSICRPNFGWNITTSGFWKQTSAMLEFYFCFRFSRLLIIGMLLCICLTKLVRIGPSVVELWRHSDFQDGGRQPYWIYLRVTTDHPQSVNMSLGWVLKVRLDRIYNFGEVAIFMLWGLGLKSPIYVVLSNALANQGSAVETNHIFWFVGIDLPIQHPTSKGIAGRFRGVYWWRALFQP